MPTLAWAAGLVTGWFDPVLVLVPKVQPATSSNTADSSAATGHTRFIADAEGQTSMLTMASHDCALAGATNAPWSTRAMRARVQAPVENAWPREKLRPALVPSFFVERSVVQAR